MNIKLMVNFKTKKAIHTDKHAGTKEYQELLRKGYKKIGTVKIDERLSSLGTIKFKEHKGIFWEPEYFEPADKYEQG